MAPLIIGRPDQKGSTGRDNRMKVCLRLRFGAASRDEALEKRVPRHSLRSSDGGLVQKHLKAM
jgi:hypothetical protein